MRPATAGYWRAHDPAWLLGNEAFNVQTLASVMPPRGVHFFHDPSDRTVSIDQSFKMRQALVAAGVPEALAPAVVPVPFGHADLVLGPLKSNPRLGIHVTVKAILSVITAA
jgi:hypothetical protein